MHNYSSALLSPKSVNVAVVGSSGYSGFELLRILKKHPAVSNLISFGTKNTLEGETNYHTVDKIFALSQNFEIVFLATHAEVSLELAPKLLKLGISVIDLSGAFRLNTENIVGDYLNWYKIQHSNPELVKSAHYGLVPWSLKKASDNPILIANPGCYATAILMALLPLLKDGIIEADNIVIDAKSGATGAGKKAEEGLNFCEVDGECLPYKVGHHQHLPEIILQSAVFSNVKIEPHFSTHLLPVRRGIIAGIYTKLKPRKTAADIEQSFCEYYAHYPLVKFSQEIKKDLVSLKKVVGTPSTHISYVIDGDKLYLYSVIDNLLKGAASQAIENFNIINDLPVITGLESLESMI